MEKPREFRVLRSRATETHKTLRDEIMAALESIIFDSYQNSFTIRADFEAAFAAEVQQQHAVAVHSGTVGLFLALRACGIGPGDEVITVGNSDISTTGAISQIGGVPVLCDVFSSDYTINTDRVESLVTDKTRALLPVDMHGHPANVKALRPIADRYNLMIVEDAALAAGAIDYGLPVGAFADVTMFSFSAFKPLGSSGNGAVLVTNDEEICDKLRLLAGYGHDPVRKDVKAGYQNYIEEGYNVPLDGLEAAVLSVKLPYLKEWTGKRRAIVAALEAGLADTAARTPVFRAESLPTFRSYAICVDHQFDIYHGLRDAGIEAAISYAPPIYQYSVYAGMFPNCDSLTVTERLGKEIVNLPITPELTSDDVDYMIEVTRKLLNNG
ncbi:MAG: DegT/DnrJ/EryC1/StrS family aminotransferase [Chloroflexi bacterium]|nr:DegT/DnrJ/EryC1/StrS family aminotransferase [Chloroflexota bacterium]